MIYLQLFLTFLKIGFFGFGGGYAMLSLIQDEVIVRHNWLTLQQFTDIVAVSQMTPGPIAINSATYVGYMVTGNVLGSVLATVAVCVPPMTVMLAVVCYFNRHRKNKVLNDVVGWLRPLTTGMIGAAALMLVTKESFPDIASVVIFLSAFAAVWFKVDAILVLALAAVAGIIIY